MILLDYIRKIKFKLTLYIIKIDSFVEIYFELNIIKLRYVNSMI